MSLAPGTPLGIYEITGLLGAGGMGEVYRARDTKLGRDVAIKTLPAALAGDKDRLARFEREAKLLASLNHAHIAGVYGLDAQAGTLYIAMELVEGESLEEKLKGGALPVREAIELGLQIALALEAAHAKGVVHRDLKPANIMITPDSVAKVLDFGLAKAFSGDPNEANPAHSPALSAAMTQAGLILGTAGYMAPEQASGQAADQRADIWSFGVVVYEMLTGLPVFRGESVPHIMAAVLQLEPDWDDLPRNLHPRIRSMLERCLQKKPRSRYAGIADARTDIEVALNDAAGLTPIQAATAAPARLPIITRLSASLGLAVAGAAIALLVAWLVQRPTEAPGVSRLLMLPTGSQAPRLAIYGRSIAISPDGRRVTYLGVGGTLLVRALDETESYQLVPTGEVAPSESPFFSPDGQRIGYFAQNLGIYSVNIQGGPRSEVVDLAFDNGSPGGAAWADDGTLVFATLNRSTGLFRLAAGGTDAEILTTPDPQAGQADHLWPEYLPGGRAVLFTITATSGRPEDAQVAVLDLDTGQYKPIVPGGSHAHYTRTGHLIYSAVGELRAVRFDAQRLTTIGTSVAVEQDTSVRTSPSLAGEFDVSLNGTLIYLRTDAAAAGETGNRRLVWVSRTQQIERLDIDQRAYLYPRLAADEDRVLLDVREGDNDIWLLDLRRNNLLTNLTQHSAIDRFPIWAGDEAFIFESDRIGGQSAMFRQRIDSPGEAEQLSDPSPVQQTPNSLTPDGSQLIFDRDGDLFLLELDGSRKVTPLLVTPFMERRSTLSPDGRWLAFHRDQPNGGIEVFVRPFPNTNTGMQTQISRMGGAQPWWSRAGDELFYYTLSGEIMSARIGAGGDWTDSRPTLVLEANDFTFPGFAGAAPTFDVSADGQRFLVVQEATAAGAASQAVTVVQNWFEELERASPID